MSWRCRDACAGDYASIRAIASESFPEGSLLPAERFLPLLAQKPALVRVLERASADGRRDVRGYTALWPMSRGAFELLASGALREKDLSERHLLDLGDREAEVLYVMDICAGKHARGRPGTRLALDLLDELRQKLTASPQLSLVAAWAYTREGARLCERAGMQAYDGGCLEPRIWHGAREAVLTALSSRGGRAVKAEFESQPASTGR